jgi:hypothetical protein
MPSSIDQRARGSIVQDPHWAPTLPLALARVELIELDQTRQTYVTTEFCVEYVVCNDGGVVIVVGESPRDRHRERACLGQ